MARIKLELWDSVVADCESCLGLAQDNLKAHYYLSQAQLHLKDYDSALSSALRAHELCVKTGDKSLAAITTQVLNAKKERWEWKERHRLREARGLETEIIELMEKERRQAVDDAMGDTERSEIEAEWNDKIETLRQTFEKGRTKDESRREVPDWAVDDISFGIMVDPVIVSCSLGLCMLSDHSQHHRQRPESPMRGPPSWSTSEDIPVIR